MVKGVPFSSVVGCREELRLSEENFRSITSHLDLPSQERYGHDSYTRKGQGQGQSVLKIEWKRKDGRTDVQVGCSTKMFAEIAIIVRLFPYTLKICLCSLMEPCIIVAIIQGSMVLCITIDTFFALPDKYYCPQTAPTASNKAKSIDK